MTPAQAIQFLEQMRLNTTLDGRLHDQYRIALNTLALYVAKHEPKVDMPGLPKPTNERPTS